MRSSYGVTSTILGRPSPSCPRRPPATSPCPSPPSRRPGGHRRSGGSGCHRGPPIVSTSADELAAVIDGSYFAGRKADFNLAFGQAKHIGALWMGVPGLPTPRSPLHHREPWQHYRHRSPQRPSPTDAGSRQVRHGPWVSPGHEDEKSACRPSMAWCSGSLRRFIARAPATWSTPWCPV